MKIEFIKRGAATRLILIFAGWSTDARYYNDCVVDGWDTAVVSDYRDISMPTIPYQYRTVYIFAYSLGVAAASLCNVQAAVRVAVNGSPKPVSDEFGIPESIYAGTLDGLNERSLKKFHLRMAGDKATYESLKIKLPELSDISLLKEELISIRDLSLKCNSYSECQKFDRAYIAEDDRIFPSSNLKSYWQSQKETETVTLKAPHAVDLASIVRSCMPDTDAIGAGFARAGKSYNDNAVVQKEICKKITDRLMSYLPEFERDGLSLLEIGAGKGLLTEEWSKLVNPDSAVYIDLTEMPLFGAAREERYVVADAETWLEETDEKFDIILSASTIQWFADPVRFISTVRSHLNAGGIAILSTFVKGNLKELDAIRPCPIIYKTENDFREECEIETEVWDRILKFDSSKEMLMHLRLTGVTPVSTSSRKSKSPGQVMKLSGLPNELTYRPMIIVIRN